MKIRVLSDLHFEHHADSGLSFVDSLDSDADLVVLAGDITIGRFLPITAFAFTKKFPQVVYVHGNHEFYGSDRETVLDYSHKVASCVPNKFHWLDHRVTKVGSTRILGTSLWYPETRLSRLQANIWSDFLSIKDLHQWVYKQSAKSVEFLRRELRQGDVVVTHFLPSWKSVHPKYAASDVNCFFVHDLEELIIERQPSLWIHGHTHESMDYMIGSTRVICNPFGYLMHDENPKFNPNLNVEIP